MSSAFERKYTLRLLVVFGAALVILLYRFTANALFTQMALPPVTFYANDFAYRLFYHTGIMQVVFSGNLTASLADVLLFTLPVMAMATQHRFFVIGSTLLFFIYLLTYNWVAGHNYHGLIGWALITVPFWSKNEERFDMLWGLLRYYLLYIFASAALWKIFRGVVFDPQHMTAVLQNQHAYLLWQNPDGLRGGLIRYLIEHPGLSQGILAVNVLLQLSFGIGFFTTKADRWLFVMAMFFAVANFVVMDIVSFELLILLFTLHGWEQWPFIRRAMEAV